MRIIENTKIALDTYKMILQPTGPESEKLKALVPGQFINIKIEGFYLRRPISIADWDDESLIIIYKVVGKGTFIDIDWWWSRCSSNVWLSEKIG